MPRAESQILLVFLLAFRMLEADAVIAGACASAGGVCTPASSTETNADLCDSELASACVCNINYADVAGTCTLIDCTTNPTATCGNNTACTAASKCSCAVNYEVVPTTADTCTAIACTWTDASACTDTEDYCEVVSGITGTCACKKNFVGTNTATCTRISCPNGAGDCTEANSACHTLTNAGCGCDTLYTADATTGACSTQKTCTVATVTTDCGTNTVCEQSGTALLCFCQSNYEASVTGCVEKTCNGTETTNCDANSQCSSSKCACADNFVINGRVCECPSTGFSLVGGVCKKACTATSECGTNGACFKNICECEPNYAGTAPISCTQIACSGTDTTTCAAASSCTSSKCVCSAGSFVEETDKLACAGCEGIFCNFSLMMASLLMFFFAGKRFE